MKLYMMVTKDKYELPIAVADTAEGLANMTGKNKHTIMSCLTHGYKHKSQYKKIIVPDDDDSL